MEKAANEVLEERCPVSHLCEVACLAIVFVLCEFIKRSSIRNLDLLVLSKRTYLSCFADLHRLHYNRIFSPESEKKLLAPYKADKPV